MKTDIETLRDSFWLGYDEFLESRVEAEQAGITITTDSGQLMLLISLYLEVNL